MAITANNVVTKKVTAMRTTSDYVIIKLDIISNRNTSGLYVSSNTKQHVTSNTGTVACVGPGRWSKKGVRIPVDASVGDRVRFDMSGNAFARYFVINGQGFKVFKEFFIMNYIDCDMTLEERIAGN
jgi:co-chaperonin GroES (HSP10)